MLELRPGITTDRTVELLRRHHGSLEDPGICTACGADAHPLAFLALFPFACTLAIVTCLWPAGVSRFLLFVLFAAVFLSL